MATFLALAYPCLGDEMPGLTPPVVWSARYDGTAHGDDRPCGMAVDSAGNCWLAGFSFGDTTDFDFAAVRFNSDGSTGWVRRYGSPSKSEDRIWAMARDSAGDIIVTGGSIADFKLGWDFLVIKYNHVGDRVWLRRYDSPWHSDDKPAALAVGPGNTLYIAGYARHRPGDNDRRTDQDIALLRYSPAGETIWTRLYNGTANRDDGAAAIAVDSAGNCYVAGKAVNAGPGTDVVLLKYREDGTLAWQHAIDGPGKATDLPATVLLGPNGRVYLAGSVTGTGTSFDYYTACFDTTGRLAWQQSYDGAGKVDIAAAACLDLQGNMIVTGQSIGAGTSFDIATVKYSAAGKLLWSRRHNGARGGDDRGTSVAADRSGRIIVGGTTIGGTGFPALRLLGYSAEGDSLWIFDHAGTGAGKTEPVALRFLAGDGQLYIAATESNVETGPDFLLMLLDLPR